jgi:ATP-dependent RNA helicase DBP3
MLSYTSKFAKPTPIQSQCMPFVLSGRDVVGIAATGSGKTLAFMLPGMRHATAQAPLAGGAPDARGPVVLVLAPTRELAMQSAEVCDAVGGACGVSSACVYGGVPKGPQKDALRRGCHVVVATPGRLLDLMSEGAVSLKRVTFLVLDEADRMLDLGFEADIRKIIGDIGCPAAKRQTVMFSATWPDSIKKIAAEFLNNPVKVTIGSEDLTANHMITQTVEVIDGAPMVKDKRLLELLAKYHGGRKNRVLVFVLYKKEAARVEEMLNRKGWAAKAIHGDKGQNERTDAVAKFKSGATPLLIATDVAARGLDIPGVEVVINYSFPLTVEDYVHRIGRTGRGGATGISHTLFTAFDKPRAGELMNVLREASSPIPADLLAFGSTVKKKEHALYGAFGGPRAADPDAPVKEKVHISFSDDE